jgi:hypothetical protein
MAPFGIGSASDLQLSGFAADEERRSVPLTAASESC